MLDLLDYLILRPYIDLVTAAQTVLFDGLACSFTAAFTAEVKLFLACTGNYFGPVYRNRTIGTLGRLLYWFEVNADFRDSVFYAS